MDKFQSSAQCDNNDRNVKATCSKFRQAIAHLISTNDANLLDAIECLHIECKGETVEETESDWKKEIKRWESQCQSKDERIADLQNELSTLRLRVRDMDDRPLAGVAKDLLRVYHRKGMGVKYLTEIAPKYGLRYCDPKLEPRNDSTTMGSFDDIPLTSLEEALQPLTFLNKPVDRMLWTVKQKCQSSVDSLTLRESATIMLVSMEVDPHHDSLYTILNETLRENDSMKLEPWFLYLRLLMSSLLKLPSHDKEFLYRGAPLDLSKQYPAGLTFVWRAFYFCTPSREMVEKLMNKSEMRTIFKIESRSGRNIRGLSCFHAEDEIVLLPGRRYQVVSCDQSSSTSYLIHIREVESPPLPTEPTPYQNPKLEKFIANQKESSWMKLNDRQLTDEDMDIVGQRAIIGKGCREIDLGNNLITGRGMSSIGNALKVNTDIQRLYLGDNHLSDDGVRHLVPYVKRSSLVVLGLSGNRIGNDGAEYLSELLRENTRLTVLGLEDNQIGDRGVEQLALGLRSNRTLERLLLKNNRQISDACADTLIQLIGKTRSLKRLDLRDCSFTSAKKGELRHAAESKRCIELWI